MARKSKKADKPVAAPVPMPEFTLEAWRAEALKRFGSWDKVSFVCPACGNVATPADFLAVRGEKSDGERAAHECIGRLMAEAKGAKVGEWGGKKPCNWAAYGLFSTLGKGVLVRFPDSDKPVQAFAFADAPACTQVPAPAPVPSVVQ